MMNEPLALMSQVNRYPTFQQPVIEPFELPTDEEMDKRLAEVELSTFIRQAWPVVEPATQYLHNWHIDAMSDWLMAVTGGQVTRLIINIPPRTSKSSVVTIFYPCWEWLQNPSQRWVFSSYGIDLSRKHSVARRDIILSPWYQRNWGSVIQLSGDQNVKTEYANTRQGVMLSTSTGGTVTGFGGNRIIIDDPLKPEESLSDLARETANRFFDQTLWGRLDDKKKGAIVLVMQRLHENDLTGHLLSGSKSGEKWEHLCLPAEDTPGKVISTPSHQYTRARLLWPEREDEPQIAAAKLRLGPYGYAGQYLQQPAPPGGGRFKREWYRYFTTRVSAGETEILLHQPDGAVKIVKPKDCTRWAMMDPAGAKKTQNNRPCYTVIMGIDITPARDILIFDMYRQQVSIPQAAEDAEAFYKRHGLLWLGIEKNGIGLGVVQMLQRTGLAIREVLARGAKEARSETAEIMMAAGRVYFLRDAPWLFALQHELEMFPAGEYADQADTLAHSAQYVNFGMVQTNPSSNTPVAVYSVND
jgi:predicted phage terminase large subunit-like protein